MESSMSCGQMLKYSLSKLVMEFVGTMVFTIFFVAGGQTTILLGLWILNIFFWKISGSHFNPAVTLAFMLRRDEKRLSWKIGVAYIVAQLLGAYAGALLSNFYTFALPILIYVKGEWLRAILQELLCSFLFVFFFMITTDDKLLFSEEKAINCFILASSYIGARSIFYGTTETITLYYGAVMNPAVALGIQLASIFSGHEYERSALEAMYLYPTVPFGAAFLAVLFYEFIYKKTQAFLHHEDEPISDDGLGEHD